MLKAFFGDYAKMACAILAAICISAGTGWLAQRDAKLALEAEMEVLEYRLTQMSMEHQAAIAAAESALKARDEIYEISREKERELDALLSGCPDFAALPLPDGLREKLAEACLPANRPSASRPSGGHSPAQPR